MSQTHFGVSKLPHESHQAGNLTQRPKQIQTVSTVPRKSPSIFSSVERLAETSCLTNSPFLPVITSFSPLLESSSNIMTSSYNSITSHGVVTSSAVTSSSTTCLPLIARSNLPLPTTLHDRQHVQVSNYFTEHSAEVSNYFTQHSAQVSNYFI